MIYFIKQKNIFKKGYTLLFAVLVASLVLAVGISIMNISKKEFLLTTSARDSSLAFYAADGAIECAVYGDQELGSFAPDTTGSKGALYCGSAISSISPPPGTAPTSVSAGITSRRFSVKFGVGKESCADVVVFKKENGAIFDTIIEARGYNFGWNDLTERCDVQGPKKVERGIRLSY